MSSTLSKTINPQLVEVSFANNIGYLQKYSTYLDLVSDFKTQLNAYFAYDKSFYNSDFISSSKSFYGDLNGKYASFDNEFLIYYVKKYNILADEVKKAILPSIGKQNFLSPISDSIGMLTNTETMLTDYVEPVSDVNVTLYPAPLAYPSNLKNKIRPTAKAISIDLSKQTTIMFRNNIVNVQFKAANSTEPHGSNLVTDFNSYLRTREYALDITKQLSSQFGNLFKLVSYYGNLNDYSGYNPGDLQMNLQTIADVTYTLNVEGAILELDLLGKQIEASRKDITIKRILSVQSQAQTKPVQQPINTKTNTGSTKAMPLNSTAPGSAVVVNNVLKPNTTTTAIIPANNTVPPAVGFTKDDRKQMTAPLTKASAIVKAKPDIQVGKSPNISAIKIPTVMPEFPRMPFAFAVTSPFGIFSAAKSAICALKNLNIQNFKVPPIPDLFKKGNFAMFKNKIMGLIVKAEIDIKKKLLAMIPNWPKINEKLMRELIKKIKDKLKAELNKLFNCNPDNKN
jgi:hypothetical protein